MSHISAPRINLLSKKKAVFDEQSELALRAKVIAGVVLIGYMTIVAVVFGLVFVWNQRIEATKSSLNQVQLSLASHGTLIQEYEQTASGLKQLVGLLNKRHETVNLWTQLQQLIPVGCELTSFSIDQDILRIGVSAPHVILANQALDVVEKSMLTTLGAHTVKANISRGDDAAYRIDLEISLQQAKQKEKSS